MSDFIVTQLEAFSSQAHIWGFVFIFLFMTMESTIFPLPSEIVMIPAGFFAFREELTFSNFYMDAVAVILIGTFGSIFGAWINYWVSLKLGRPILYKYGKYFFMPKHHLERAEEVFNRHGDIATFSCRLVPVLRHLISIPAGLSQMEKKSFTFYTGAGAFLWMSILTALGAYLGKISGKNTSYHEIVASGEALLHEHLWAVIAIPVFAVIIYIVLHSKIVRSKKNEKN